MHTKNDNEKELLLRIAEGDETAFYDLFTQYAPLLRPFALKYTHSESDTEEIIQETFIRIWLSREKLPEVLNLRSWIYRIAARVYLNHVRKEVSEQKRITQAYSGQVEHITPLHHLQVDEIRQAVHAAILQMPEQRGRIYRMSREQGLKPAEIADRLGMPVGTVKNQLSASLKDIRAFLIEAGHDPIVLIFIILNIV